MGGEILNSFLNSFNDNYTLQIVDIATASHNYFPKPDGLVATEWAGVTHHAPSSPSAIFSASVPTHIITLNMPNCSSVMGVGVGSIDQRAEFVAHPLNKFFQRRFAAVTHHSPRVCKKRRGLSTPAKPTVSGQFFSAADCCHNNTTPIAAWIAASATSGGTSKNFRFFRLSDGMTGPT
jgi:hypothetical protein